MIYMFADIFKQYAAFESAKDRHELVDLLSTVEISLFVPLTILLCFYYSCLRNTLNNCLSPALQSTKRQINIFFAFVLFSYCFRFAYELGNVLGIYNDFICWHEDRFMLNSMMCFTIQLFSIIPMLCLHRKSFSKVKEEKMIRRENVIEKMTLTEERDSTIGLERPTITGSMLE